MDIIIALGVAFVFLGGLVYFAVSSDSNNKNAAIPVSQILEVESSTTTASTSPQPSAAAGQPASAEPYTTCASASRLRIVVNFFFALGCFAAVVIFMAFGMVKSRYGVYHFSGLGILYALSTLASTILLWAFGHAIADIADNTAYLRHDRERQ